MKQKLRVFAPGGSVTQMEALAAKIKPQKGSRSWMIFVLKGRTTVKTCENPMDFRDPKISPQKPFLWVVWMEISEQQTTPETTRR